MTTKSYNCKKINEACGYHLHCYRTFTDISKLARAKKTIANSRLKRPVEENSHESDVANLLHQAKVARTRRQLQKEGTSARKTSSNVLPQICLICKRPGSLYITDAVDSYVWLLLFVIYVWIHPLTVKTITF